MTARHILALFALLLLPTLARAQPGQQWLVFEGGGDGPGKGKHVVLLSGDEEYRSEEALPQLAKILSKEHGFTCTVLFALDPKTGEINPKEAHNIPNLAALDSADLLIILTRFRDPPEEDMKHIDDFLKAGKPVIGLRTATHAFNIAKGKPYARYSYNYKGDEKEWDKGFGRLVLGETWVSHWGSHKNESTRGIFAPDAKDSPLFNGIKDGEIWGPTDVYEAHPGGDSKVLLLGQVTKRNGPAKKADEDPFYGMSPDDKEPAPPAKKKEGSVDLNKPMQPVAWTKSYQLPGGKAGKALCTTMGSATDLTDEALRRFIVNGVYWLLDMKVPEKAEVTIVGDYKPTAFGFDGFKKGMKPADMK
jgi:hypothetical protein